jgi:two-component system cell cycle response regulator DivK
MTKVLIAEDNEVNRELLRELLEMREYTVLEACNGQEALQLLENAQPDILLLDLSMPVLDGFGTIQRIRQHSKWAKLPVLAVTAFAMQGDREKVLQSGFDGYLSKPIDPAELQRQLSRLVGESQTNGIATNKL